VETSAIVGVVDHQGQIEIQPKYNIARLIKASEGFNLLLIGAHQQNIKSFLFLLTILVKINMRIQPQLKIRMSCIWTF